MLRDGVTTQGLIRVFGPYLLAVAIVYPLWLWPRPLPFSAHVTATRVVFDLPAQDRPLVAPNQAAADIRIEPVETLTLSNAGTATVQNQGRAVEVPAGATFVGRDRGGRVEASRAQWRAAAYPCRPSTLVAETIDDLRGFGLTFAANTAKTPACPPPSSPDHFVFDVYAAADTTIVCESCAAPGGATPATYDIVPSAAGSITVEAAGSPVRVEVVQSDAPFSLGNLQFDAARFIGGTATDPQSTLVSAELNVPYVSGETVRLGTRQLLEVDAVPGSGAELTQFVFENRALVVGMHGGAREIRAGGQIYRLNLLQQLRAQTGLGYLFDSIIYVATFVTSLRNLLREARQTRKKR